VLSCRSCITFSTNCLTHKAQEKKKRKSSEEIA